MEHSKQKHNSKNRIELIEEMLPQFETFVESREKYIKALETTIDALQHELESRNRNNLAIRNSIDELVAMQRMSNTISTALKPEAILTALVDLTKQVIPIAEADIFLLGNKPTELIQLTPNGSARLLAEAREQLESGIVDWVFSEKRTVIIPDLKNLAADGTSMNFVIVPLFVRNTGIGFYLIHTEKQQQEFSNQDVQLLTVLANQAAAGVENWRTYEKLVEVNNELKASEAQMIHAARLVAIGELATSIVHEIKNPVQVLMLQLDVMKRGTYIPNAEELIHQQVLRLQDITRRLMSFARNVSDNVQFQPTDVNKVIMDTIAIVEHEYKLDRIEFELDLQGDLPLIPGNSNYLQQVFLNLAINARDAMPQGGKVIIQTSSDYFHVFVSFSDTGAGISQENLDKIFQPFFTTKEEGKGTGLGLAICRKIVNQHEGEISVESEVGKGTTFTIKLPIRRTS
ncbi:MAG: GAF domain-containing protein [Bacteroidetes bacterium]|nr:GAF domain-containing protein [Bacteroidota bacterium]